MILTLPFPTFVHSLGIPPLPFYHSLITTTRFISRSFVSHRYICYRFIPFTFIRCSFCSYDFCSHSFYHTFIHSGDHSFISFVVPIHSYHIHSFVLHHHRFHSILPDLHSTFLFTFHSIRSFDAFVPTFIRPIRSFIHSICSIHSFIHHSFDTFLMLPPPFILFILDGRPAHFTFTLVEQWCVYTGVMISESFPFSIHSYGRPFSTIPWRVMMGGCHGRCCHRGRDVHSFPFLFILQVGGRVTTTTIPTYIRSLPNAFYILPPPFDSYVHSTTVTDFVPLGHLHHHHRSPFYLPTCSISCRLFTVHVHHLPLPLGAILGGWVPACIHTVSAGATTCTAVHFCLPGFRPMPLPVPTVSWSACQWVPCHHRLHFPPPACHHACHLGGGYLPHLPLLPATTVLPPFCSCTCISTVRYHLPLCATTCRFWVPPAFTSSAPRLGSGSLDRCHLLGLRSACTAPASWSCWFCHYVFVCHFGSFSAPATLPAAIYHACVRSLGFSFHRAWVLGCVLGSGPFWVRGCLHTAVR